MRRTKFPDIEAALLRWIPEWRAQNGREKIPDKVLFSKGHEIAKHLGYTDDEFKASAGWLANFKNRNGVNRTKSISEASSLPLSSPPGASFLVSTSETDIIVPSM